MAADQTGLDIIWSSKDGASLLDTTLLCPRLASLVSMIIPLPNSKNHCYFLPGTGHKRERLSGLMGNPLRRWTWQGSRVATPAGCVFVFYSEIKGRKNTAENINGIHSFTWFEKKNSKSSYGFTKCQPTSLDLLPPLSLCVLYTYTSLRKPESRGFNTIIFPQSRKTPNLLLGM